MKTLALMFAVLTIVLSMPAQSLLAQSTEHDSRVKDQLDKTDLKYEIDDDGDFKLLFEFDDSRSHIVFVNSQTETYGDMEIREVWSVGYVSPDEAETVSSDVCENLIRANATAKMGAWQIIKMDDKEVGVFRAMVPANASREVIIDTMKLVGITADEKESELLDSDEL